MEEVPNLVALGGPFIARCFLDGDGGEGGPRSGVSGSFHTSVTSDLLDGGGVVGVAVSNLTLEEVVVSDEGGSRIVSESLDLGAGGTSESSVTGSDTVDGSVGGSGGQTGSLGQHGTESVDSGSETFVLSLDSGEFLLDDLSNFGVNAADLDEVTGGGTASSDGRVGGGGGYQSGGSRVDDVELSDQ